MNIQNDHNKTQGEQTTFSTNYGQDAVWEDGLRDFFEYRDLGVVG